MRLIDADALHKTKIVERKQIFVDGKRRVTNLYTEVVMSVHVENAPTIDHESLCPQGKWIPYHEADFGWDEYGVRCSNCNWKVEDDDIKFSMPFCPKCGARMRKGNEN